MWCFFMRAGRVAGVEMLTGLSDKDAIAKAPLAVFGAHDSLRWLRGLGSDPLRLQAVLTLQRHGTG